MKHINKMVGAGVLALALTVTGCSAGGGGGNKATVDSSKGASDSAALPTTAWEVAGYDAVAKGGTLTLAVDQLPDNWNALQADGANAAGTSVIDPTSGGPVRITADGSWEINPDYATEVKVVSDDPQVVEIKLNPKAVWEDGTPMSYKDFEATVKANNGSNDAYQNAADNVYKDIESVTREDTDQNFKITFKNKNADWVSILGNKGSVLPASVASTPEAFNTGYATKPVPSNGPYVVSNIDTTAQVVTLTPNPKWWGQAPKLDKIIMKVVNRDALAQAYANKEIDALIVGTSKDNYDTAKKREDGAMQQSGGVTWSHITLNAAKGPLADVKVRQAVAHAIDRDTITASRLSPIGAPVTNQNSYIYMPGQKGYEDNGTEAIGYDVAKAESLLKDAGYAKGSDGTVAKDGAALTLTYTLPANNPVSEQIFKQIQANLKAVGITLKNNSVPSDKYFSDYVTPKNFELTGFSWVGTPYPVSSTESIFYPVASEQNFTGITEEKLGDLWAKANAELDPEKRIALANEIDKTIFSYVPVIPLTPVPVTYGVKKGLVNYGAAQFQDFDWTTVGFKS
ncbi:ABC transporter family substrate-binding protein [Arthrobacter psychrolactophilus]